MERVQTLSAAKKQIFPEAINNDTNIKQLLAKMPNRLVIVIIYTLSKES